MDETVNTCSNRWLYYATVAPSAECELTDDVSDGQTDRQTNVQRQRLKSRLTRWGFAEV